jgi:hypothetical protein
MRTVARKRIRVAVTVFVAGWVLSQAIVLRPKAVLPGDGDIGDHVEVPPHVDAILHRACYDCHSAETRWPWYAYIAPASWFIVHDVQHARWNLDFSSWSVDPVREPTPVQRLKWICTSAERGKMPPALYRFAHRDARLSAEDREAICRWTRDALSRLGPVE